MDKIIDAHLEAELGGAYKDLAAAKEEDNAARASDYILFSILMVSIVAGCLLIFFRLALNSVAVREALNKLRKTLGNAGATVQAQAS